MPRKDGTIHEKRKRKRMARRMSIVLGSIAATVVVLALIVVFGFRIRVVEYEGECVYSNEEIRQFVMKDGFSRNSLYLWLQNRFFDHRELEFVDSIRVDLKSPSNILITIDAKETAGYVVNTKQTSATESGDASESADASGDNAAASGDASSDAGSAVADDSQVAASGDVVAADSGKYVYFDSSGRVVEFSDRLIDGPFHVECTLTEDPVDGETLSLARNSALSYLLEVIESLGENSLSPGKIVVSDKNRITLYFGDITVELGTCSQTAGKMLRLAGILPKLSKKSGTIDMSEWSSGSDDIIFKET
ncbi:MAG: cell division protein FtsQ [Eubacterium sp.]|nr:cell division protein FtsQ [Eubacterium sp.]